MDKVTVKELRNKLRISVLRTILGFGKPSFLNLFKTPAVTPLYSNLKRSTGGRRTTQKTLRGPIPVPAPRNPPPPMDNLTPKPPKPQRFLLALTQLAPTPMSRLTPRPPPGSPKKGPLIQESKGCLIGGKKWLTTSGRWGVCFVKR